MSYGEVQKQDVLFIRDLTYKNDISLPINANPFKKCCYDLQVFADLSDSSEYKNDFSSFIELFDITQTPVFKLQELVNGVWTDIATIVDGTYGEYFDSFAAKDNIKPWGVKIEWQNVLSAFGIGTYRVEITAGSTTIESEKYCLKTYNASQADETVRITFTRDSIIGDFVQSQTRDFAGLNWVNQYRFNNAEFGRPKGTFTIDSVRYQSGLERTVSKEFREEYELEIMQLPVELNQILLKDIMMSDEIIIDDYNSTNNSGLFVGISVEINGNFEPRYNTDAPTPSITLSLMDKFTNQRKYYN